MSTVKTNNVQVGQSLTATNNFTLYQPSTPDGTVRLGNGNSGSVTDVASFTSAGVFSFNSGYGSVATAYGCRAWVNFNGTGTVAIRASGNVSSITDNGVGTYAVNLTNAMPDTNYCVQISSLFSTAVSAINNVNSITTTVINVTHGENTSVADTASIYVAVFR